MKTVSPTSLIGEKNLTVRDLLRMDRDVDVYDDVCEELAIAFCNPFDDDEVHNWEEYLTERGMKQFADVLDYPIHVVKYSDSYDGMFNIIVHVDDEDDTIWKKRLKRAKIFFEACAGFCTCTDYEKWFKVY